MNMKLRLAIIIPAVVIMLGLAALAFTQPDLARPLTIAIPVVGMVATGSVFFLEQAIRRRNPELEKPLTAKGIGLRKLRLAVLVTAAVFVAGLSLLALTQPADVLPFLLILTIVVGTVAAITAISLERRAQQDNEGPM